MKFYSRFTAMKLLSEQETSNTFTAYYLGVDADRPFIKEASRIGLNRKQKEAEIANELHAFLYK